MYNPIRYIKDVIDILRNPLGEATHALEITTENIDQVTAILSEPHKKYAKLGDFFVDFENGASSICPRDEFFKHYAFTEDARETDPTWMRPIKTIKPL